MPAQAVLDAAWAILADQASRHDEMLAANGKQPEVLERLTEQVWGVPAPDVVEAVESADEETAVAELRAMLDRWPGGGDFD